MTLSPTPPSPPWRSPAPPPPPAMASPVDPRHRLPVIPVFPYGGALGPEL